MGPQSKIRLQRLTDERNRAGQLIEDVNAAAEAEKRDLSDSERESQERYRTRVADLDVEIAAIAGDLERERDSRDVSVLLREETPDDDGGEDEGGTSRGPNMYRTFAQYARDVMISRYDELATRAGNGAGDAPRVRAEAVERLQRAVQNTTTTTAAGLVPPQHIAQIMDIIDKSRPVVASARHYDLVRGKMTYPKIAQRPDVQKQTAEKTQGGSINMQVTLEELLADTYIGAGDISWQTINWSTPDALALWFELAAESYARQTETAACLELGTTAVGTVSPVMGTVGTEDFGAWRAAVIDAIGEIYTATGGRTRTDTLYVSPTRFFQIAALGSGNVVQLSAVGQVDVSAMTGTFAGLRVVGSYGFTGNTAIVGDSSAFMVAETPGAPVEMRAVEPSIGGMEVGIIGAFKAKVYDGTRFKKLNA
jgi:HK97 family phage major capsid protein